MKIFHKEDYRIFDSLKKENRLTGWVRMFMAKNMKKIGNPIVDAPNLIVAQGREFAAQKLFRLADYDGGTRPQLYDYKISHFAVGKDGATVDNNIVTLTEPSVTDLHLGEPIDLGTGSYLTEPSGVDNAVKEIISDGSILLEPVVYDSTTYYTQVKCTCVLNDTEPTSLNTNEAVEISEAGLYIVNGSTAKLFSHICFAPKWKEKSSQIIIEWYIMF